ncbi:MAG: AEC family transporter [Microcella sp.]
MTARHVRETGAVLGVLTGFAIIGAVVLTGYLVGRARLLPPGAQPVLGRLAFFVLSPALLFTVLAEADTSELFSALLPVSIAAAVACFVLYALVARLVWRRAVPETTVGALASGYTNANNIGLPVAAYVLGDPALVAPVILFQLIVAGPLALTVLDISTSGRVSLGRILSQPVRNPIIIGSLLGVIVSVTGLELPEPVLEPFRLIGAAAVPVVLLLFGMSLNGSRVLAAGTGRRDVLLAVTLKVAVMPVVAWAVGALLLGLEGAALFTVVTLAALPAAQNVFVYASRFDRGTVIARDAVLLSSALSVPALIVIAAFLAP